MTIASATVRVDLSGTQRTPDYDILIGEEILAQAGEAIAQRVKSAKNCVIVSDSNVAPLYQKRLENALEKAGLKTLKTLVVPAGEASKNFAQVGELATGMLALGVDRKTLVCALGGGVVGDLAGFAASMVMRGIDFVQIPSTLLAMSDSSVGGKTGIDTPYGKNTLGAFYQPRLVIADVALLSTLPKRELLAGYAEVVKYGLIGDRIFFDWCKANGKKALTGDRQVLGESVRASCVAKAKIVAEDEREAGKRALLNLGHTFGHALESATGFGDVLIHGEAVAIGTIMAFRMAVRLGLCPQGDCDEVIAHFLDVGLPTMPPAFAYDIDRLIKLMAIDKKAESGEIALVLPHGIGNAVVHKNVNPDIIRMLWAEVLKKP